MRECGSDRSAIGAGGEREGPLGNNLSPSDWQKEEVQGGGGLASPWALGCSGGGDTLLHDN